MDFLVRTSAFRNRNSSWPGVFCFHVRSKRYAMLLTDMIVVICRCPSLEKNYPLSKYFMNRHSGFTKRRLKGIKQYE